MVAGLIATMKANEIDVAMVDPFISSHRVTENDNNAIEVVAKRWNHIAEVTNAAVDLIHHSKKTFGVEVTVEDGRGASALLAAVRSAQVLNKMTPDDAAKCGVENRSENSSASRTERPTSHLRLREKNGFASSL